MVARAVKMTERQAKELVERAYAAAGPAMAAAVCQPMLVGTPKTLFGTAIDYTKPVEFVADGVCGFAWVEIRPARGPLVTYMKKNNIGRYDDYRRCWYVNASGGGQSMERKEAWARAFAKVLREAGVDAYFDSRMD